VSSGTDINREKFGTHKFEYKKSKCVFDLNEKKLREYAGLASIDVRHDGVDACMDG
jgi:hypothetical protein